MWRLLISLSLTILLGAAGPLPAQSPSPRPGVSPAPSPSPAASPQPAPLAALPSADLARALKFMRENYVAPAALSSAELDRATLAGLLARLGRGVTLLPPSAARATPSPAPFYREIIAGHIGYLRPSGFRKNDLAELDNALKNFAGKKVDAIVLDLRAIAETGDYGKAAEFAQHFVPKGEALFSLRGPATAPERVFRSDSTPAYSGFLIVLIDEETAGAPEVLASVLRARAKAILIGQATAGGAVEYADLPLAGGMVLRVAVAQAVLPEESAGFPQGVIPDLAVAMPATTRREIFAESLTKGIAPFVFEAERPHLNEAALLAGTNPEIEVMQANQQRRARGEKLPPHDLVLQRAVDVITSIEVYAKKPGRLP